MCVSSIKATNTGCRIVQATALCETDDDKNVIPTIFLKNDAKLRKLHLNYVGPPTALWRHLLNKYPHLTEIKIRGNINQLGESLLEKQSLLRILHITNTLISEIPESLFSSNTSFHSPLMHLVLDHNKLTDIPLKLFSSIPKLEKLSVANNCIQRSRCDLGSEFTQLRNLKYLDISGVRMSYRVCNYLRKTDESNSTNTTIGNRIGIFQPINKHLEHLNLANTVWVLDKRFPEYLAHFASLKTLDLSGANTLVQCPHTDLSPMLKYLPSSLTKLRLRLLRSLKYEPQNTKNTLCFLTADDMAPIRSLPNLETLDFERSDLVFGYKINSDLFHGMQSLKELNLGYCRISVITPHTFQGLHSLSNVNLDGNPLGSRQITLQSSNRTIKTLSMRQCGMASDNTSVFHPVSTLIKSVHGIDLSANFLQYNPLFIAQNGKFTQLKKERCESQTRDVLHTSIASRKTLEYILLDDNYIEEFRPAKTIVESGEYCLSMAKLVKISLQNNKLKDMLGICDSVKQLFLRDNELGDRWKENMNVIKLLKNLEVLDLTLNQINILDADLFSKMPHLRRLYLNFNSIERISDDLLVNNENLKTLSIAHNRLQRFDFQTLKDYSIVEHLHLHDNRINYFDKELLQALMTGKKKQLSIDGNPIACRCETPFLKSWLTRVENTNVKLRNSDKIVCEGKQATPVLQYTPDHTTCFVIEPLKYTGIALACLCFAFLVAWPCYKYRWYIKHPQIVFRAVVSGIKAAKKDNQCEFDAYIAYNHESSADCDFVANILQPALEDTNTSKVCF